MIHMIDQLQRQMDHGCDGDPDRGSSCVSVPDIDTPSRRSVPV